MKKEKFEKEIVLQRLQDQGGKLLPLKKDSSPVIKKFYGELIENFGKIETNSLKFFQINYPEKGVNYGINTYLELIVVINIELLSKNGYNLEKILELKNYLEHRIGFDFNNYNNTQVIEGKDEGAVIERIAYDIEGLLLESDFESIFNIDDKVSYEENGKKYYGKIVCKIFNQNKKTFEYYTTFSSILNNYIFMEDELLINN